MRYALSVLLLPALASPVLAQDRESCVVYGMPRTVVEAGLADHVVSLDSLAAVVENLVADGRPIPRAAGGE